MSLGKSGRVSPRLTTRIDEPASSLGYQPAFDGIRGLAVVAVLVFHLGPGVIRFGSYGVDIFFALSGFLITTLIVEERDKRQGKFGFAHFYARRSLRLFPALYSMLVLSSAYLVLRRDHVTVFLERSTRVGVNFRQSMGRYLVAAATYTSNFRELSIRPGNLVGHTWSLAVEEQFYLLWPMVLCVCLAWVNRTRLAKVLAMFLVGCLVVRIGGSPPMLYRTIVKIRPDGLLSGAAAALLRLGSPRVRSFVRRKAVLISNLGLTGIVVSVYLRYGWLGAEKMQRGGFTLLAVCATATIFATSVQPSKVLPWLGNRTLVRIGAASYGLYIWHYPIFMIVKWELSALPPVALIFVKLTTTVVATAMSMRYIERPAMRYQSRFRFDPTAVDRRAKEFGRLTAALAVRGGTTY